MNDLILLGFIMVVTPFVVGVPLAIAWAVITRGK